MTPERKQQIETALSSCGPERRWKTDKLIDGKITVGNGHCFVALEPHEFAELGVELPDAGESRLKVLAEQIALDKNAGGTVSVVGEFRDEYDGAAVYRFAMGWMFPLNRIFVDLLGSGRATATSSGEGFVVISRGENGIVVAGAISLGNYSQQRIVGLMEKAK